VSAGRPRMGLAVVAWLLVVVTVGGVTYLVVDGATRALGQAPAARTVGVAPTTVATPTPSETRSTTSSTSTSTTAGASTTDGGQVRTSSFPTRGGTIVASCRSGSVRLDSITVRDGWRFEDDTDDERVEVKLESGEDEIELKIVCVGGEPTVRGD